MKTNSNANDNYYHLWVYLFVSINKLNEPLKYKLGYIEACPAISYSRKHLTKRYKYVVAVNNINFVIQKGHCFNLLGLKGVGEASAIEIMNGIIKASKGQCFIMLSPLMSQYRKKFAFQHTALQDFLTIKEILNLFSG
ncbi:MAG: ABC-type multidrug transport system ATPase subunit [Colwellia sp.]